MQLLRPGSRFPAGTALVALAGLIGLGIAGPGLAAPIAQAPVGQDYALETSWVLPAAPSAPIDLGLGPEGLYAIDGAHNEVLVFDVAGRLRDTWRAAPDDEVLVPASLAVDDVRQRVHLLWMRYERGEAGLVFRGLYLDTRRPDGSAERPLRSIAYIGRPVDMAVERISGDLFVSSEGRIHRILVESTWSGGDFEVGDTTGPAGQIAVLDESRLAIVRPLESAVRILTLDGLPLGRLDMGEHTPLALAPDGAGGLQVLVRAQDPDDPGAPIVLRFDAEGRPAGSRSLGAMGAPPIGNASWSWSIASGEAGLALSAGTERFHTLLYGADDRLIERLVGGRVQDRFAPRESIPAPRPPIGLAPMADGGLLAYDGNDARLVRLAEGARPRLIGTAPLDTIDIALGPEGELYASTLSGQVLRMPIGDEPAPDWAVDCDCALGGRIAASPAAVYVTRPRQGTVATFNPDDGLRLRPYAWASDAGLWPADLAVSADGRLHTADLIGAMVQRWQRPEAPDGIWQAGLLAGPRRLASARWGDELVIAAILADGFVEIHEGQRGRLLARWQPELGAGGSLDLVDLALGPDGQVYLADAGARAVHVFAPSAGIPPTESPEPSVTPTPSVLACRVAGDKVAAPSTVVLGASAEVTLTLSADCPNNSRVVGADIVLIIDRSSSMRGQKLLAAQGAARAFAELLDLRYHRLALVSFSAEARLDVPLTDDIARVIDGLEAMRPEGETNLAQALRAARAELEANGRRDALPVMILLTDGQFNTSGDDPRLVAAEARGWGAQIYTIGLGSDVARDVLVDIAGIAGRYYSAPNPSELYPIYSRILREVLSSLAGNLIIDDLIAPEFGYLPGSARPAALESPSRLRWARGLLPVSGITLTYAVSADTPGCHPSNLGAFADYTDGDGIRRRFTFPVPTICAITPTPTPSPTATATASPSPEPQALYLPLLNGCRSSATPVDVVLLVDTSSSMAGQKLEDAKQAAATFVGLIDLRRDQAAVVGFNNVARLAAGLGSDLSTLQSAIERLESSPGTRIDLALQAAVTELIGPRRKPGNQGVIVLLSDGSQSGASAELRRAALEARSLGALIYAVGLGSDVDMDQLRSIAGPERSFFASDGRALEAIYRQIATAIPCR
ncbi:MAG: VWA domain-containing protein [Caldilineae bacterium]|nr:VWA domain-containing protein [Chloroflexota bacterium]MCB9177083.1 VWA domain-containing protein [Caldilineae bacterium]